MKDVQQLPDNLKILNFLTGDHTFDGLKQCFKISFCLQFFEKKIGIITKSQWSAASTNYYELQEPKSKESKSGVYAEVLTTKSYVGISLTLEDKIKSGNFWPSLNTTSG